jgi:arylformamidase
VDILDISMPLHPGTPTWPGSPGVRLQWTLSLDAGDICNSTRLDCDVHVGTHVDAPRHFLKDGATVDRLALARLIGPATVAYLPDEEISAACLERLALPATTTRLLLRTRNSELLAVGATQFREDYAACTPEAAEWLVDRGVGLVGIDYLSIGRFRDGEITHRILLGAGVVVLEGLNLSAASPGEYLLICLPIRLRGAEGAPARAILVKANCGVARRLFLSARGI